MTHGLPSHGNRWCVVGPFPCGHMACLAGLLKPDRQYSPCGACCRPPYTSQLCSNVVSKRKNVVGLLHRVRYRSVNTHSTFSSASTRPWVPEAVPQPSRNGTATTVITFFTHRIVAPCRLGVPVPPGLRPALGRRVQDMVYEPASPAHLHGLVCTSKLIPVYTHKTPGDGSSPPSEMGPLALHPAPARSCVTPAQPEQAWASFTHDVQPLCVNKHFLYVNKHFLCVSQHGWSHPSSAGERPRFTAHPSLQPSPAAAP